MPQPTLSDLQNLDRERFWRWLKKWAKKLGREALRMTLILYYVMLSPNTPTAAKLTILGALLYLVCPADGIPDVIPVVGLTDDVAALAKVLINVNSYVTPDIIERADAEVQRRLG